MIILQASPLIACGVKILFPEPDVKGQSLAEGPPHAEVKPS